MGRASRHCGRGWSKGERRLLGLPLFDASMFRNPLGGMAAGYPELEAGAPCRSLRMLNDAAHEALCDAFGLALQTEPAAVKENLAHAGSAQYGAIVAGTNFGGMSAAATALVDGAADASKASLDGYLFGKFSQAIGERYGIHGPRMNLSLSCASGAAAVGIAFGLLRCGRADFALACGYDELSLYVYAGLSALRAITPETIRPFDARRKGTLFSEGAAVLVLETAEHAAARKAPRAYARVLGRALNNDAYHMTAPETEALGIKALMRAALSDAQVEPAQIDHPTCTRPALLIMTPSRPRRFTKSSARAGGKFRSVRSRVPLAIRWARRGLSKPSQRSMPLRAVQNLYGAGA